LVTIADTVHRTENSKLPNDPAFVSALVNSGNENRRLHELLEAAATGGPMAGGDWSELADVVTVQPALVLHPPKLWRTIIDRLLAELVTTSGIGWFQRQEAISVLLEHHVAGRYAVASCIDLCEDKSSPAVIEPLSLLDVTPQHEASRYVLTQLIHPNDDRSLVGALLAAERKVGKAHFSDDESSGLIDHIVPLLLDPSLSPTLRPLVVDVGRTLGRGHPAAGSLQRALRLSQVAGNAWKPEGQTRRRRNGSQSVRGSACWPARAQTT
jgi:hypothetical protein